MSDFVKYEKPPEYFNYFDVNNLCNDEVTIADILKLKGIEVEVTEKKADLYVPVYQVIDYYANLEQNLDKLNETGCESIYYISKNDVFENYRYGFNQVDRLIKCLNENYEIAKGNERKWGGLVCLDGYPTVEDGRIIVKGDYI